MPGAIEPSDGHEPVQLDLDPLASVRLQQVRAGARALDRRRLDLPERLARLVLQDARVYRDVAHCQQN